MNIPNVLITSTINEFKAEGYSCDGLNVTETNGSTKDIQFVSLTFKKEEEKNNG